MMTVDVPERQRSIHDRCYHPTGEFVPFADSDIGQSIASRFEHQVRQHGQRLAIQAGEEQFTYVQLNEAANRVAHTVLDCDTDTNEPVLLLMAHGAQYVAAMLGVWKTGRFIAPLDATVPLARNAEIVRHSGGRLILTDRQHQAMALQLAMTDACVLDLDDQLGADATDPSGLGVDAGSLAWLVYTSGSTGQPKGVMQTQRTVLHFMRNYTRYFHICPQDRLSMLYRCNVNAGLFGSLLPLLDGAGLYMLDVKTSGLDVLDEWLGRHSITVCCMVPTMLRDLAETLTESEMFPSLRLLYLAGEPVLKRDFDIYRRHLSGRYIFVNRLGSTETDCIRLFFADKESQIGTASVPVGYAVDDKQVLVVGDDGKEVEPGEIGEIAVRSRYISTGYWRSGEMTAAAFETCPDDPSARIYRSGDIGRMLADGCLMHMGRKGFQIKIRGHRIEAEEVELVLMDVTGVKQAVVVARPDPQGEQRLVAYWVGHGEAMPSVTALRNAVWAKLPDYMVPAVFVRLDAMPVAPNGKVNRRILPDPGHDRPDLDQPYVPPRTPFEQTITEIWAAVLGIDRVGIHDNFLELGGNSLMAGQILARIGEAFQAELPLRMLFDEPTVAEMALNTIAIAASHE